MIRAFVVCLLFAWTLPGGVRAAEEPPVEEPPPEEPPPPKEPAVQARELLLGGKYEEAIEIYRPLAEKGDPAAVLGVARCLRAQGKRAEVVKTLTAAAGEHADLHAELARAAFEQGDYKEAKTRADEAIKLDANQLLARWITAELDRVHGRLKEAERGYQWLVYYYNGNDVEDAESLRWIGLAAARYARWNRLDDQFSFIVNELYPDAIKAEPKYWPALYESGLLFLEKYNRADASRELKSALELNPNAAEIHVALSVLAIAGRKFDQAEESLARALELNPTLLDAWHVKADLAWANFDARATLALLAEKALPLNPVSEETLGRVAACYLLLDGMPESGQSTRFTRLEENVTRRNPHAGDFYFNLAVALEDRNKQLEAIRFFRTALDVMPQKIGPRSHLGLLHMRTGDEDEAHKLLDGAFDVDPFNVRVNNMLQVLEVLDEMATRETDHVVIKYVEKQDKLLARYAARYLDEVYPQLCRQYGFAPPGKPLLEIFNQTRGAGGQQWFSTRMTGMPYLGAVAASTGRMVAMASPNHGDRVAGFNWARVLKHEFIHVITLQQTHFDIPHWYTEGLAVHAEGSPRPQRWNELLRKRVPEGDLFDLKTLNFGFTRAQNSDEWQMAYCQAELYVDYMLGRWGSGRQRRFLEAYVEGQSTEQAIRRAFEVSQEEFERGYIEYIEELIDGTSALKWPSGADIEELLEAHREHPEDADAAAELAYGYVGRDANKEAGELVEKVLEDHPKHQLAAYVRARLLLKEKKEDEAAKLLEDVLDPKSPQPNALNMLAGLKLKAEEYDEAARLYAIGEKLDSINLTWTKKLATVYLKTENDAKLTEVLRRLAAADEDELTARKKLAELAHKRKDYAAAADWASQALHVNVIDPQIHETLARALVGLKRYEDAIEEFTTTIELSPKEPHPRFALADAYLQAEQPEKARETLEALLELAPDYPGATVLLESLEETKDP
ncbi:MAG: tetratricopeptide repeat protein [Candidatus Nealsonbacteria bacterium]|nr:tetratricopeptide repeat protein [Candidatus Nealsonbacteria bacterium]